MRAAARLGLAEAQREVECRAHQPALADDLKVSLRYLHHAFAHQGTPVAATVRSLRLTRCAEALATSRGRRTIASIAQDWGFVDVPNFNRLFRGRFGCSPGDYRRH
jgi:AraC-like DNA-binding protein